jgi:hypothetical protein
LLGDSPDSAIYGTTIRGICNVTSRITISRSNFNVSHLIIKDFGGKPLPEEAIFPISATAVLFEIKNIQKNQFGKYKCYYMNGPQRELINERWIHVGGKIWFVICTGADNLA